MDTLNGMKVGLSGAIPSPEEGLEHGWNDQDIQKLAASLVTDVLNAGGYLIHGSHPTILTVIEVAAQSTRAPLSEKRVILYVAAPFLKDTGVREEFLRRHGAYAEVRIIGEPSWEPDEGLQTMREAMIPECDALVCIGGNSHKGEARRPGVQEEMELALSLQKPVYLAGAAGGFTRSIYERQLISPQQLRTNGLSDAENEALARTASPAEASRIVMKGLATIWGNPAQRPL